MNFSSSFLVFEHLKLHDKNLILMSYKHITAINLKIYSKNGNNKD